MRNIDEEFRKYREQNRLKVKLWREKRKQLGYTPQKKSLKPKFRWHISNPFFCATTSKRSQWIQYFQSANVLEPKISDRIRLPSLCYVVNETPPPIQNFSTKNDTIIPFKSLIEFLKPEAQQPSLVQVLDLFRNKNFKAGNSLTQFILTSNYKADNSTKNNTQ